MEISGKNLNLEVNKIAAIESNGIYEIWFENAFQPIRIVADKEQLQYLCKVINDVLGDNDNDNDNDL